MHAANLTSRQVFPPQDALQRAICALSAQLRLLGVPSDAFTIEPIVSRGNSAASSALRHRAQYGFEIFCAKMEYKDTITDLLRGMTYSGRLSPLPMRVRSSSIATQMTLQETRLGFTASSVDDVLNGVNGVVAQAYRVCVPAPART